MRTSPLRLSHLTFYHGRPKKISEARTAVLSVLKKASDTSQLTTKDIYDEVSRACGAQQPEGKNPLLSVRFLKKVVLVDLINRGTIEKKHAQLQIDPTMTELSKTTKREKKAVARLEHKWFWTMKRS